MLRILLKKCSTDVSIIKLPSPYSINGLEENIPLFSGVNIIKDLSYGFRLSGISRTKDIVYIDLINYDTSNVFDMHMMFSFCGLSSLDLSNFDTRNVINMKGMFSWCNKLNVLRLNNFDTSRLCNSEYMFLFCSSLVELDLSNFDMSNVTNMCGMFCGCDKLNHIRCNQSFKDWCIQNQDEICLPLSMREGGEGIWEIV